MEKKIKNFTAEIGGKEMKFEVGKFAGQANAACTVQYGDTLVLATACIALKPREEIDYFPLLVDFDEKLYAAGKIKGSRFIKREGRATDEAILSGRMADRSIRPLFPEEIKNDVQIVLSVLSFDGENDPDVLGLNAAAAVLYISDIPWNGPLAAVRVGRINNEWVLNPSYEARQKSDLDVVVAGTKEEVVMIESGAKEVAEDIFADALEFGMKHLKKIIGTMEEMKKEVGLEKIKLIADETEEERASREKVKAKVEKIVAEKVEGVFSARNKETYHEKIDELRTDIDEALKADNEINKDERTAGVKMLDLFLDIYARRLVLEKNIRVDGRKLDEIRSLSAEVGVLPRTHGSGLFQRGETQVLSVVTLGSPSDEQTLDTMEESGKKRYMHHYNFPAFSVGEVKPMRGPGRREIGHGALAEKALLPVLPDKEQFPYTIRVVSEVLSSNGSSSQASICGSSLSLMDAGVPIKKAVAGIAMGLMSDPENKNKYEIITDIQGTEDHSGDMDFKVAGTEAGITAAQLDIKLGGISLEICRETLKRAKKARQQVLEVMKSAIEAPRADLSPYAPRIYTLQINPDKIRDVIGPGGKMINEIIDATGVDIDIEDSGLVFVTAPNGESANKAIEWIKNLTREVVAGEHFMGKVTRLMDFGAFVEVLPKQEGLVHISEIAPFRVGQVTDALNVGDVVPVIVKEIDSMGRINLTMLGTDFDTSKIKRSEGPDPHRGFGNGGGGFGGRRPMGGGGRDRGPRRPRF
ncbi:MAG: polyribonucleotide nucleotidyltransferase [Patescibacteria group bacterium]|nr:polyribonucleotide nucleotidyltransferase [Patescibacteria group bacterium]